jgi:hypothetical protein
MQKHKKLTYSLLALANVLFAAAMLHLCWKFHRDWDTGGDLPNVEEKYKNEVAASILPVDANPKRVDDYYEGNALAG